MSQIKELQPKEGVTLLPIQLAPAITRTEIVDNVLLAYIGDKLHHTYQLPFKCKLLGISTEIPEEVWQGIVSCQWGNKWLDYKRVGIELNPYFFKTATESAMSFLAKHEVYSVNPYGEKPAETFNHPDWEYTRPKWQQAEANTGTWVILMKQND